MKNLFKTIFIVLATLLFACGCDFALGSYTNSKASTVYVDKSAIPAYSGNAYITVNNNVPYFEKDDITKRAFERYSPLDSLGRCGTAVACVGRELMPTAERGSIGSVKPSGWQTVKYDNVDGKYLYNRCHLIGYQLTAENANERNLITGTRYLNIEGMLPFENMTADYIKETGNHVMYRVTPVFSGNNLLADGVLMEGLSVEDNGEGICFNIYAYNVQPDIKINYANGKSSLAAKKASNTSKKASAAQTQHTYILNTSSKKYHRTDCSSVQDITPQNKKTYKGTADKLKAEGYQPCKRCNPD